MLSTSAGHSDVARSRFLKPLVFKGEIQVPYQGVYQYIRNLTFRTIPHTHASLPLNAGRYVADNAARRAMQYYEFWNMENELRRILDQFPDGKLHSFR